MPHDREQVPALSHPTARAQQPRVDGARVGAAIEASRRYLLSLQNEDGHWRAELEGDTILESEYILLLYYLGRGEEERARKAANYILEQQLSGGGWAIYRGGPPEVSVSVKNYFALKLLGEDPETAHMDRARRTILDLGGVEACNSFTKIYLAVFGQYDWAGCPAVPPEMVLLPTGFFFNLYEMSSWSRGIVVPLSIVWAQKPSCDVPEPAHIRELHAYSSRPPQKSPEQEAKEKFWRTFFQGLDSGLKVLEGRRLSPLRQQALEKAESWVLEHLQDSDGIGAIFPPIVNTIYALRSLGYPIDHPVVQRQLGELEKLEIEDGDTLRLQPCLSPVWDTVLTMNSLAESGLDAEHPALVNAARWLVSKEVKRAGDWKVKRPELQAGGWYFEYANEFYPDCDDTAEALICLSKVRFPDPSEDRGRLEAIQRALRWQLGMQNTDGGWASFDKGCDKEILTFIPFADHNAMIDPSTADITARTLEALSCHGYERSHPAVRRAIEFLKSEQEEDGCWYGRWGCNYIYGTWLALWGLRCIGEDLAALRYQRAAHWLRSKQNDDGGWGETLRTYDEPELRGTGSSTASQTAWALMGLFAVGDFSSKAVSRGVEYLLRTQRDDGSWEDEFWTGTGFPKVFYLRYHLYATYFPVLALATYRDHEARAGGAFEVASIGERGR